ncbi:MAG: hypothetical protein FWH11_13485 [Micrococcales bacterium]|nr:hypothetical protein [Micrococcales bacterium]
MPLLIVNADVDTLTADVVVRPGGLDTAVSTASTRASAAPSSPARSGRHRRGRFARFLRRQPSSPAGPAVSGGHDQLDALRTAYRTALGTALSQGAQSVAVSLAGTTTADLPAPPPDLAFSAALTVIRELLADHDLDVWLSVPDRGAVLGSRPGLANLAADLDTGPGPGPAVWSEPIRPGPPPAPALEAPGKTASDDSLLTEYSLEYPWQAEPMPPHEPMAPSAPAGGADLAAAEPSEVDDPFPSPLRRAEKAAPPRKPSSRTLSAPARVDPLQAAPRRRALRSPVSPPSQAPVDRPEPAWAAPADAPQPQYEPSAQTSPDLRRRGSASVVPGDPARDLADVLERLDEPFSTTVLRLIDARALTDVQVYRRANLDRRLFSKLRSSPVYAPSKKTALALAVALELNLAETTSLLARAGYTLSSALRFDAIVAYFIDRGVHDVFTINEALFYFDQPLLGA